MLKLNDQLIQKRLLWRTTIKAFTSCWLLQMWLTTITVVYKVLLFDSFCHLSTFTSSLKELCPSFIGKRFTEVLFENWLRITKQTNHGTWVRCKNSVTICIFCTIFATLYLTLAGGQKYCCSIIVVYIIVDDSQDDEAWSLIQWRPRGAIICIIGFFSL